MLQNVFFVIKGFLGGQYFIYFLLAFIVSYFLLFFTLLISTFIFRKNFFLTFKEISNAFTVFLCLLLACELDFSKKFVTSFFDIFILAVAFSLINKTLSKILSLIKFSSKPTTKTQECENTDIHTNLTYENIAPEKNDAIKRAIERLACKGENTCLYTGYLDTSHVKSLIDAVKQRNLSLDDEKFIENTELNLLNFATRQPTPDERIVLSEQIGSLVKLIAKYQ